ncbi:PAS domain S-box protein [Kerstersia gyiorum]|uniref:sensor histidine kinase n=1 Tax=Kerstersia gyiorum TaxID=206506 RepID=UPI00214FD5BE|nr:ATP-binding protein [Kerstersia gyiorum]MCR4159518.1 PAS domain S-box protein [Kerstersia gyiorum]
MASPANISSAVNLSSWLQLQRQAAPLAMKAVLLARSLRQCGGIGRVFYLAWQTQSRTYLQIGDHHLPPGQGDPLAASDQTLHATMQHTPRLTLAALRELPCWLAGRLRRAGMEHGLALSLPLEAGTPGLLLVELDGAERSDWLAWMHDALLALIQEPATPQGPPLLATDPRPSLLLDGEAGLHAMNPALLALLGEAPLSGFARCLPVNYAHIVRACLAQGRAIEHQEASMGDRLLLWSFIPDRANGLVLARGRDATQERREAREAARSRRLYRLITENTTDLIARHDPEGAFLDASPASWTLLGYWPEELRGRNLRELLHPQDAGLPFDLGQAALVDDGYHTMTYRLRHRNGHYLWFETASRAIRDTYTGAVVETISVLRDITARVQAEANKRRLEDELAHTSRLITLGELASGIAHEINQPLAAVMNYAGACQNYLRGLGSNPQAADRVQQGLSRISEHAAHASAVIRRLRAFLRKDQRRVQAVDVGDVVQEAIHLCAWEADQHQVIIDAMPTADLPSVYADRVLLQQVLLNLLRNAIDANRERHPGQASRVVVDASACHQDGYLRVRVRDQGPGLDQEAQRKVFTPFYTSKQAGLGLGLSMSRNIVEGFGGELDIVENGPAGLTMECRLPLRQETPAQSK